MTPVESSPRHVPLKELTRNPPDVVASLLASSKLWLRRVRFHRLLAPASRLFTGLPPQKKLKWSDRSTTKHSNKNQSKAKLKWRFFLMRLEYESMWQRNQLKKRVFSMVFSWHAKTQKKQISWRAESPLNFGSGMVLEPSQPTPTPHANPNGFTTNHSHRIHVWYMYLQLVDFPGKCK